MGVMTCFSYKSKQTVEESLRPIEIWFCRWAGQIGVISVFILEIRGLYTCIVTKVKLYH